MANPMKAAFKQVPLDAKQQRLWEDTLSILSWQGPGFVHLAYTMFESTGPGEIGLFTEDIQYTAATDGLQMIFKPSAFFKLTLMKRVFAVFHEMFHVILEHCSTGYHFQKLGIITVGGKTLPYVPVFANIVQDLGINATLIASKLGEFDEAWLFDKDLDAHLTEWVELYFRLWKDHPPPPQRKPGQGQPCDDGTGGPGTPSYPVPGKSFDEHLEPGTAAGKDPHEVPERNQAAWDVAIDTAMTIQRAQGKLPAALEHFFDTLLKPNVDWTEHVRGEITRLSGSGAYSWQKLDRRLAARGIGAPSVTGHGVGLIVQGTDTSGSIFADKTLLERFIGETAGMLEDLNPAEIRFLSCDTRIAQEFVLHDVDDLRAIIGSIKGGGGTSFEPVFDYIEANELVPDVLIYLTDGDGTFPAHEPDYPVIWGDISGRPEKYPWGKVVFIPTSKED